MTLLHHITHASTQAVDPEIAALISKEYARQESQIEMIASENFASQAVMAAQGSVLTNKYAEGYPHFRYYGGCEHVDAIEDLAIERLKKLYQCGFANVQPHSGSQANQAVFHALMNPGDTFLGMRLDMGGHLTHGSPVNLSGKNYRPVSYGLDPQTGLIDMEAVRLLAHAKKPKVIIAGASAYSRTIDFAEFRAIADEIGAYFMVDMAHISGLVAARVVESPVPYAHVVTSTTHKTLRGPRGGIILWNEERLTKKINSAVFPGIQGGPLMHVIAAKAIAFKEALSEEFRQMMKRVLGNAKVLADVLHQRGVEIISGGTDNHMVLVSLAGRDVSGHQIQEFLEASGITCNKNGIPNDPRPPKQTSGIRLGTPPGTTRGFGISEFTQIGSWIADVIEASQKDDLPSVQARVRKEVADLCQKFPLYPEKSADKPAKLG
ncbi:MAG: serine hydroxymethyltransferase [Alphaproteobacteria bacterium]|nr:MAG: serine hydroxymethyltransferase [Alphaproteobacteria bacterium]